MLCMHFCGTVYFVFHCLFSSLFLAPDSFSLTAKIVSLVKQRACGQTSDGRISSIAFPCLCWKHTVYRGGGLAKSPQVSCQVNHGMAYCQCYAIMWWWLWLMLQNFYLCVFSVSTDMNDTIFIWVNYSF